MIEPSQREVYRLCGIEQPEWCVSGEGMVNVGKDSEPIGAMVALWWIALLGGRTSGRVMGCLMFMNLRGRRFGYG